jgi:hypothetical protein
MVAWQRILHDWVRPSRLGAVLGMLAVLAALPATPAWAGPNSPGTHNLLVNPDFDNFGAAGWSALGKTLWTNALDAGGGGANSGSVILQEVPGTAATIYQCVNLPVFWRSVNFSLSWFAYAVTTNGASQVQVQYFPAAGCPLFGATVQVQQQSAFSQASWNQFETLGVVPPANAQSALIAFNAVNGDPTTSADAAIDDTFFGYTIKPGTCGEDPTLLCVDGNRFQITAQFTQTCNSGNGESAAGVQDNADGGYLWCFDAGNPEIFVKVLNACTAQGGDTYWVFLSGLTNVGVKVTVLDTKTGIHKTYTNPNDTNFAPIFDTVPGLPVCP